MFEEIAEEVERYHDYFAEATALSGFLQLPFEREIRPHALVKVTGTKGGYEAKQEKEFWLESAISFRSGYTQVAGNRDLKPPHRWTTLATSVVEGLNVFDIVTADRVVAQISTEHPIEGYVPSISFLGTRFENLRIAGHPVKLDLNPRLFGDKPAYDAPYTQDKGFLERVAWQHDCIRGQQTLPVEGGERYNRVPSSDECRGGIECSLVNRVEPVNSDSHPEGYFPGRCFGHVIEVPNFGVIYLATVSLEQSDFHPHTGVPMCTAIELKMLDIRMGCPEAGTAAVGGGVVKGTNHP